MSEDINTGTISEALNDKSDSSAIRQRIKEIKMYAKIINEETKQCDVGTGTNTEFYKSIGMTEMDVEQAYNGDWYVKGFAPERPESEIIAQQVAELKAKLADTDYAVIKIAEATGEDADALREKYAQVIADRKEWRKQINELENKE